MTTQNSTVNVTFNARDNASRTVNNVGGSMSKLTAIAGGLGIALGAAGLIRGVAGTVAGFAKFELSMAKAGVISGATTEQLASMTKVAKELGRTTVFTATQASEALTFLAMAGFQVEEATKALPGVLQLAAAAGLELATAADIASNVLTGYGLAVEELPRVNDVLSKSFTSANTNLLQLSEAMKLAGPLAKAAGVQFEETSAALALMGNAGFQGSLAGTALRGAMTRLLGPTKEAQEIMDRIGFTALNSSGNLNSLTNIVEQLENSSITTGEAMTLFGQRAGPAMLALVGQGSGALRELVTELENSGGTAEEIANAQLNTLSGQWTLLTSAADGLSNSIGMRLNPFVRQFAKDSIPVINVLTAWIENTSELEKSIDSVRETSAKSLSQMTEDLVSGKTSFDDINDSAETSLQTFRDLTIEQAKLRQEIEKLSTPDLSFFETLNLGLVGDPTSERNLRGADTTRLLAEARGRMDEVTIQLAKSEADYHTALTAVGDAVDIQIKAEEELAKAREEVVESLGRAQILTQAEIEDRQELTDTVLGQAAAFKSVEEQRIREAKAALDGVRALAKYNESWDEWVETAKFASGEFKELSNITMPQLIDILNQNNMSIDDMSEKLRKAGVEVNDVEGSLKEFLKTGDLTLEMYEEWANGLNLVTEAANRARRAQEALSRAMGGTSGTQVAGLPVTEGFLAQTNLSAVFAKMLSQVGVDQLANEGFATNIGAFIQQAIDTITQIMSSQGLGREEAFLQFIRQLTSRFDFHQGGMVPGPIGAPMTATVHGGEFVATPAMMRGGMGGGTNVNIYNPVIFGEMDLRQLIVSAVRDEAINGGFSDTFVKV